MVRTRVAEAVRLGLPQGNIRPNSIALIERLLNVTIDKRLLHHAAEGQFSVYLLKHRDIPRLLHSGKLDIGITSDEWVYECGYPLVRAHALNWCDTRVSLLSPLDRPVLSSAIPRVSCVTEFKKMAMHFFRSKGMSNVHIERVAGSTEGLVPSLFDCSIDCVQTGDTSRRHALTEEVMIFHSKIAVFTRERNRNWLHAPLGAIVAACQELIENNVNN